MSGVIGLRSPSLDYEDALTTKTEIHGGIMQLMSGNKFNLDDYNIRFALGQTSVNVLWLRRAGFHSATHISMHCHSGYELHIIPYGSGLVVVNGKPYELSKGTLYLTGPGVYHEQKTMPEDPMEEYCINFEIDGGASRKKNHPSDDLDTAANIILKTRFWIGKDIYGCSELFQRIMDEISSKYLGYSYSIKNYLAQIFINISRSFSGNMQSGYRFPEKDINDCRRIIIDEYFNSIDSNLSISDLAEKVGLSVRQLNRIMLKYYNMPFNEKLNRTRMEIAAGLLSSTCLSVKEISGRVGIDDQSYFSRLFKKYWGCVPTMFKQEKTRYLN
jgi:AraC-like DNA-binding protein/mannose-6-phosphate isomerase-like protein (cupin superfamily)